MCRYEDKEKGKKLFTRDSRCGNFLREIERLSVREKINLRKFIPMNDGGWRDGEEKQKKTTRINARIKTKNLHNDEGKSTNVGSHHLPTRLYRTLICHRDGRLKIVFGYNASLSCEVAYSRWRGTEKKHSLVNILFF